MATIRKCRTKRGIRWQAIIRLAGCDPLSRVFPTRQEAVEWARSEEARLQRARRLKGPVSTRTLDDAIDLYTQTVLPGKAATTRRTDILRLAWWRQRIGELNLRDVTKPLVASIRDELRRDMGGPTVNRYLAALSAVMTRARREWEWIDTNPVSDVQRFRESPGRTRYFTADESERLLAAITRRNSELRVLFLLALATGLRQSELLALTWDRVDLTRRALVVYETKNRVPRGVPIPDEVIPELRSLTRRLDSPLLFRIRTKIPWNTFRRDWEAALREAGIEGAVWHSTRHSTASHAAMSGATERELMDLLGHKTPAMARRYSHFSPTHLRGVSDRAAKQALPPSTRRGNHAAGGEEE